MAEGYYYTLSAIAQSFAAIIALSAIFVIYRLQLLRNERNELIKELRRICVEKKRGSQSSYSERDHSNEQVVMMSDNEIISEARGFTGGLSYLVEKNKITLNIYDKCRNFSKQIIEWLKRVLIVNGIVIVVSLGLLPWGKLLPCFLQYSFLIIILLFSFVALFITGYAILFILRSFNIQND